MSLLNRLLEIYQGNRSQLARDMEVGRSTIDSWVENGFIPERYALDVQQLTGGTIKALQVLREAQIVRSGDL